MHRHRSILVAAALLAALAVAHGHSCGDDFFFHLQSWFDAAAQFRHGDLHPHWLFHGASNAGEPRFVFYPPLSWELGGLLALLLPFSAVPATVAFVAFCIAGFGAYTLVRPWGSEAAALFAACVFLANPYLLLDLVSRDAYGQIFATAFFPFLLAAVLRRNVSPWRLGLPLALMWLSNVPLGILGTYLYVGLAAFRLGTSACTAAAPGRAQQLRRELRALTGGMAYGLALPAFFLLPAISQRRYIRMADAFLPPLRVIDNFLGHRTLDPVRDAFLLLTQHVVEGMALATAICLSLAALRLLRRRAAQPSPRGESMELPLDSDTQARNVLLLVTLLSAAILFGITFLATPFWTHLPALWIVQFPWRLLFAFGLCLALSVALLLKDLRLSRLAAPIAPLLALTLTAALAFPAVHRDVRTCPSGVTAGTLADNLARNRPIDTVDEYVVAGGNNDVMRPDNPPFWLTPDPQAFAPGTTPNLSDVDPNTSGPFAPPDAHLSLTPLRFTVHASEPTFLVVNLQDYPQWMVHAGDALPPHTHREDGLVAIPVPAGDTPVRITWRHSLDEVLGWTISALALLAFALSRRIFHSRPPPPQG